jgi:Type IV secretion system pilin
MFLRQFLNKCVKIFITVVLAAPLAARATTPVSVQNMSAMGVAGGLPSETDPRAIVGPIINSALGLIGLILIIFLVYAGYTWMTAGGNSDKVEEAKTTIKNCIIGLFILILAYSISAFVISAITGTPLPTPP